MVRTREGLGLLSLNGICEGEDGKWVPSKMGSQLVKGQASSDPKQHFEIEDMSPGT